MLQAINEGLRRGECGGTSRSFYTAKTTSRTSARIFRLTRPASRRSSATNACSTPRFPRMALVGAGLGRRSPGLRPVVELQFAPIFLSRGRRSRAESRHVALWAWRRVPDSARHSTAPPARPHRSRAWRMSRGVFHARARTQDSFRLRRPRTRRVCSRARFATTTPVLFFEHKLLYRDQGRSSRGRRLSRAASARPRFAARVMRSRWSRFPRWSRRL